MFGLDAEETRASVKIHKGTFQIRSNKDFFQFIKEHWTAWPGVSLFPLTESVPAVPECIILP
jgi:hypothetical protein